MGIPIESVTLTSMCFAGVVSIIQTPKLYCRWSDLLRKGQDAQKREGEERERERVVCAIVNMTQHM
jgi:hypothetical protein